MNFDEKSMRKWSYFLICFETMFMNKHVFRKAANAADPLKATFFFMNSWFTRKKKNRNNEKHLEQIHQKIRLGNEMEKSMKQLQKTSQKGGKN